MFGMLRPKKRRLDYDQEQLKKGMTVEMEHTTDPKMAECIAMHHLDEHPHYYDYLEKMEKEFDHIVKS